MDSEHSFQSPTSYGYNNPAAQTQYDPYSPRTTTYDGIPSPSTTPVPEYASGEAASFYARDVKAPPYVPIASHQQQPYAAGSDAEESMRGGDGGVRIVRVFGRPYKRKTVIIAVVVIVLVLILIIGLGAGLGTKGKGGGGSRGRGGGGRGGRGGGGGDDGQQGGPEDEPDFEGSSLDSSTELADAGTDRASDSADTMGGIRL